MEKNNDKRKIIKILLVLAITSMIGISFVTTVFASDTSGELEREFIIDVNSPESAKDKEDNIIVDVNKPSFNPAETGNGFVVDVNKPKEESTIRKENPYEPSDPSQARGTITESVGVDNKEYPRRSEVADVKEEASGGQMRERPKADAREFLTFQTKSGKVFHLIINHDEPDSNVQLLTEVSEQDLLNMIEQDEERNGISKVKEEAKKEVVKKEEPEIEEPEKEDSKGSFLIVLLILVGVGGAGYYFKFVKSKEEGFDDFEDDEIPNDDDFFSNNDEEINDGEVEDEDIEYTKEDLI
jgi:flagellar basal body-associated protein FliL